MSARMRMPAGTSRAERDAAVSALLNRLGLAHVRDTRVGDKKTRGISGGAAAKLVPGVVGMLGSYYYIYMYIYFFICFGWGGSEVSAIHKVYNVQLRLTMQHARVRFDQRPESTKLVEFDLNEIEVNTKRNLGQFT